MSRKTLIVITGPTGSGKSDTAVELAQRVGAEIISADSRQIYRGIPIGTAAPTPAQRRAVPHHFVDMLELDEYYSAAQFEADAIALLDRLFSASDYVVMCGGSMLYVDAVCKGIDNIPTISDAVRAAVVDDWHRAGDEAMLDELRRLDPEYYERVDRKNMKRVLHAVEICRQSGTTYTSLRTNSAKQRPFRIVKTEMSLPRDVLFDRINCRVEKMVEAGLVDEARRVYPLRHLNSLNTVGYKEMFAMFDGVWDLPTAVARIQKNTRVYAKKQMTWFARDAEIRRFAPGDVDGILSLL